MDTLRHIVLAGDSIFDNDSYVPGEPGVIDQLRRLLPSGWSASKIAVDGHRTRNVKGQLGALSADATDLIVSVGGNDALPHAQLLNQARSADDLDRMAKEPLADFASEYRQMLDLLAHRRVRCAVCTIYTAIPFSDPAWRTLAPYAIGRFNDIILREAGARGLPVLRLDQVCTQPADFSAISPIEPSAQGGQKIVEHIMQYLTGAPG